MDEATPDPESVRRLVTALIERGRQSEALEEVNRALERDASNIAFLVLRADLLAGEGLVSPAQRDLVRAADILLQRGQPDEARHVLSRAREIDASNATVSERLAELSSQEVTPDADEPAALLKAVHAGYLHNVELLVKKGISPETREAGTGNTPLIIASARGYKKVVQHLLEHGVDVDGRNRFGQTPLMLAVREGHLDIVRMLLEQGADVNAADEDRCTALMESACYGHPAIARLLIERGARVDARHGDGDTALTMALAENYDEIVRILKAAGAADDPLDTPNP